MSMVPYVGYDPIEWPVKKSKDRCRRGHLRTEKNTYWASHNGKRWRMCKQCKAFRERVNYHYRKENNK